MSLDPPMDEGALISGYEQTLFPLYPRYRCRRPLGLSQR